jgi:hypothetical protein|tara:strand:- start:61 stop:468 length:408 start_codon:yes stop_codon:yes gene_type:complete
MPSLEDDTRLVMTILFVGAVSGVNIYFYTQYGFMFPYAGYTHALLFGILTIGGIMILKAIFDLLLFDRIEDILLQRKIDAYWLRKQKEEENRQRVRDTMRQYEQQYAQNQFLPQPPPPTAYPENTISPTFLTVNE